MDVAIQVLAISRLDSLEGVLAVLMAFVIFFGSVFMLLSALFGPRMGYLVAATAMFGFMVILSTMWVLGVPGSTPPFRGPKGELAHWSVVGQGPSLSSEAFPAVQEYPAGPWKEPGRTETAEVEPVTLAFQEFLAEEANRELRQAGIQGTVTADAFVVEDIRFTEFEGTPVAAARGFAESGGPEVTVLAFKDPGEIGLPSYLFLAASLLGFGAHLPFLDRAERRRKEILTGGEQPPWLGPA